MMRRHTYIYLVAGCIGLLAAAPAAAVQTMTPVPGAPPAPDFELPDTDGKLHRLSQHRGKVVLLNFWATWCPPCRKEMPSMQRLWQRLKDKDFVILAVDVGEDEETVFAFTFELDIPIEFPLLLDRDGTVSGSWPVLGLPTTFVIDKRGRIAYQAIGGREWDAPELVERIEALIQAE